MPRGDAPQRAAVRRVTELSGHQPGGLAIAPLGHQPTAPTLQTRGHQPVVPAGQAAGVAPGSPGAGQPAPGATAVRVPSNPPNQGTSGKK